MSLGFDKNDVNGVSVVQDTMRNNNHIQNAGNNSDLFLSDEEEESDDEGGGHGFLELGKPVFKILERL